METKISPKQIYDEVSKTVIGQHEAKTIMANATFLHFTRIIRKMLGKAPPNNNSNVMIMGPSGNGKTFLAKQCSEALRTITGYDKLCPFIEIDCTELSGRGWVGENITEILANESKKYRDANIFESSIVFLDEFDKLCERATGKDGCDHNRNTQYNLLKTIEGCELTVSTQNFRADINTSGMLFVLAGNFASVRHNRKLKEKVIGFEREIDKAKLMDKHQELEEAGMITQLVGRTSFVAEIEQLGKKELEVILKEQIYPEYKDMFQFLQKDLVLTDRTMKSIVKKAIKQNTGARSLKSYFLSHVEKELFNCELDLAKLKRNKEEDN
jgi:ATP-dependent Clp protease ATP-binding subunit ClpX